MTIKNINECKQKNELDMERDQQNINLEDEYYISEITLEKHNFHTDYDKYKCQDCDGLGYFFGRVEGSQAAKM